ncbi:hypothetical protein ABZ686_24710 [Streptomyces sp. NPDC006992]|uniref:hypothetical protein n=1 Tax=unclassified Streptomyces TaxID=2593676 RepID=UPI0033DCE4BF
MQENITHLAEEVIREGEEDWVMVDFLIGVSEDHADANGGDFREISVALLRELLDDGLMEIGDLGESGFEAWSESTDDAIAKFKEGCESLNWRPMGGLWWLANTEKGAQWLHGGRR